MEYLNETKANNLRKWIIALSVVLPVAVALLFKVKIEGITAFRWLPYVYAGINALTAVLLIWALKAIKQKNILLHFRIISVCLVLSCMFLLMYVTYHITNPTTYYGDTNYDSKLDILEKAAVGGWIYLYYTILISHVLLSVAIVPLVLFSYLFARTGQIERHKAWVRFAFPAWLYVAITGVVVFLMISPYYLP
jgi:putative membrane protein